MATKNPGTAIARPSKASTSVVTASEVVTKVPTSVELLDAIQGGYKLFYDGEEGGEDILAASLAHVESMDDLKAATSKSELDKVADHLGETVILLSVDGVRNSEHQESGSLGVYLVVSAKSLDGSRNYRFAVGQRDPMVKIAKANDLGGFPWAVAFERSAKPTKAGYSPVNLVSRETVEGVIF